MARKVKSRRKATSGKRTQRGRGIMDVLRKAHTLVKSNKLISRGLRMAGKPGLANAAAMLGYGKKRKKRRVGISVRVPGLGVLPSAKRLLSATRASSLLKVPRKRRRTAAVRGSLQPSSVMRGRGALSGIAIPGARTMKGRGFIGKTVGGIAGGLLGGMLPF